MTDNNLQNPQWQQSTLEKVLLESVKEQKRKRRWGIFFKLIYLVIILGVISALSSGGSDSSISGSTSKAHVALINIKGVIMDGNDASADNIVPSIDKAFADPKTVALILKINSPGGSPVQAAYVYDDVMRQRHLHPNIKVYAVCTDLCASAAYYIASSANNIYANPSSLVGSIGVLMDGFGFVDTLNKLGVERRLIISGSEKGFLDPFSPMSPQDKAYAQTMLDIVHQQFIHAVENGRGKRLKNSPLLFSGLAWTGMQAYEMGLIDGFGSSAFVAREIVHNTNVIDYTKKQSLLDQFGSNVGAAFAHQLAEDTGLVPGVREQV